MNRHRFVLGRLGLLAVVMGLSAFGGGAAATTRYVSPDGGNVYPYTTPEGAAWEIQSAVDAAVEGDEVLVGRGVYREHVILKEGVNLSGSGRNEVTIHGVTPVKAVLTLTWENAVEGLTIVGPPYSGVGIYAELGVPPAKTGCFKPFRISDCRVCSCPGPGILMVARQQLDYTWMPESAGSEEDLWDAYAAATYRTELAVEVSQSEVTNCHSTGIAVHIEDKLYKYRTFGFPDVPVEVGFKHGSLTISDSAIAGCSGDGVLVRAGWCHRAAVTMDKCIVRGNGGHGVYVSSGGATSRGAVTEISNSLVSGNGEAGIWSFSIDDGTWCTPPFGGTCIGVEPFAAGDIRANSCTIVGNSVGIVGSPFPPGLAAGTAPRISLKNCIVYGNKEVDIDFRWFEYAVLMAGGIRHSCVGWNELAGVRGNIDSDPLFADPENGDYKLQPVSPCIDAGGMYFQATITPEDGAAILSWDPGKDLDGNPRISGDGPDMGAYEVTAAPPNYLVESSEDLVNWTGEYYGPATTWTDPDPGPFSTKFYRVGVGM